MFTALAAFILIILWRWPQTPIGKWLHHALVEAPVRRVRELDRQQVLFLVAFAVLLPASAELVAAYGSIEIVGMLAWHSAAYVDAALATATLAVAARARGAWRLARAWANGRIGRVAKRRARRHRPVAKPPSAPSDDDRTWAWTVANDDGEAGRPDLARRSSRAA